MALYDRQRCAKFIHKIQIKLFIDYNWTVKDFTTKFFGIYDFAIKW